ncbi:hypothetical protein QOT17_006110 [Balamuthia mandrillaris]
MDERVTMQAGSYFDFLREAVDPVRLVEEIKEKLGDEKEKFEDSKAWFGERLGSNVVQMLEDGTLVELEHLRLMYFLMLHTGKQLEAFCGTRSLPHSGKKAVKAFRILQSFYCGWEEDIEPPFKDLADFPFDGPGTEGPPERFRENLGTSFSLLDLFLQYITLDLLTTWMNYTNRKAEILIGTNEKPSYYKYGAWPPIYFASWVPVAVEDMKRWLAVLLGKNCLGKGVSRDEFWSSGSWFSVDFSRLNKIMGRDRWSAISSFFCIYNLDDDTPVRQEWTPYRLATYQTAKEIRDRWCADRSGLNNNWRVTWFHDRFPCWCKQPKPTTPTSAERVVLIEASQLLW